MTYVFISLMVLPTGVHGSFSHRGVKKVRAKHTDCVYFYVGGGFFFSFTAF